MKKIFLIILIIFLTGNINPQTDSTYISPSLYYTYGSYSNSSFSNSIEFYNTLEITKQIYLVNHYNNLNINTKFWNYLQQTFLAGGYFNFFPLIIKGTFAHYSGEFESKPDKFISNDFTNLYNIDGLIYSDDFYFGISYSHLNQIGYKKQTADQFTLRIEKILSYEWFVSLKPNYTRLLDGRKLFSASGRIHFLILPELLLKAGGFLGERAYYFDSDLLTIFNQDETQKNQFFIQAEYFPFYSLIFTAAYQNTSFQTYSINYITFGVKANLFL